MTKRDELAALLADMPDADIDVLLAMARRLRVTMAPPTDPELAGLPAWLVNAPVDDEPWTKEDEAASRQARRELAAGEGLSPDDVRRMIGA